MNSLLDIGPLTEEVEIRGIKITVQGLTAGHLFQLFAEFPDMRKLLQVGEGSPQTIMLQLAPDLIAKIIAIATGMAGNAEVEAKAKTMGASDQLAVIAAVQRLSFPDGIGPFVERVTQLMGSAAATLPEAVSAGLLELSDQIACAIQRLTANGHTRHDAWACTPRQLVAWCELIERERMRVMAQDYENLRYSQADPGPANKYHDRLLSYAAGKTSR